MFLVESSTVTRIHKYFDQISVNDCVALQLTVLDEILVGSRSEWNAFTPVSDLRHPAYGSAWMSQWNMLFTLPAEGQVRGHRGVETVYKIIEKRVEVEGNGVFSKVVLQIQQGLSKLMNKVFTQPCYIRHKNSFSTK